MIAFLHTNKAHISNFENLVRAQNDSVETQHYVNKDILDSALETGVTDTVQFEKEIETIRKNKPSLIICTCSTYGAESDKYPDVYRIDQPIITYLVNNYTKIGLAYTANSTKTVSENLMHSIALKTKKTIEIVDIDCSDLWQHFEKGDLESYNKGIAKKTINKASEVDVFFLAQASMAGAKTYLTNLEKEVFTSPEFGIKKLLNKVNT
ncbi:hypothetical protein [Hyunsoonleella pacifica]|uniref:Asp/Glu/hydantoin racemase n=1 Tax=Hyunsoonleella pacifica TaxID=1080224 RepID=A0A4Q9FNH9_9FLAO|nr:hypothetical protein [Hyunsoonleella pacifica]TBN13881.1 hypothetical protein EYD46_15420 [Hyunsoonleella pacifica]GGD26477.1 hypothetical protein GCM10011368_30590 [Hyunsoonleella pacifica]